MKVKTAALAGTAGMAVAVLMAAWSVRPRGIGSAGQEARRDRLEVWSVYDGFLESKEVRQIMSQLGGAATIVELIPDGTRVQAGDVLVRFDGMQWERELLRLERDCNQARQDLHSFEKARLPLEILDLEMRLMEARRQYSNETQMLADSRQLLADELIAEQEVKQQEVKVEAVRAQVAALEQQLELTRLYLHPAQLEKARSTFATLEQELNLARRQMSNCVLRAPSDGIVAYRALSVGGEFRTVRVGDSIYRNQPFMTVSDMSNMVMRLDVPEGELARVRNGCPAQVRPLAYPDLVLTGEIESVGSMAQSVAGRSANQRFFNVVIRLQSTDERLRAGMSARARVLSYVATNALLVPRAAVWWEGEQAWCQVWKSGRSMNVPLKVGMANETYFEVLEGLQAGDRVVLR